MRFKVHDVDSIARAKGFRRNHTYRVALIDADANPERGPLIFVQNRAGEVEGFYADQGRWADRGRGYVRAWRKKFAHSPIVQLWRPSQLPSWGSCNSVTSTGRQYRK